MSRRREMLATYARERIERNTVRETARAVTRYT